MKKKYLFIVKSLSVFFACIIFFSCEEKSIEVPYFQFSLVSKCERDSIKTIMTYNHDNRLSEFNMYLFDSFVCSTNVNYNAGTIQCVIKDVFYRIQLSNTRGGIRAESVTASLLNGSRLYYIEYEYDEEEGRLWRARLDGVDTQSIYNHYVYEGNTIIIDDAGIEYRLNLSSEENTGYVCNVLDYAGAPITSQYIINPDLYFLNIYGTPIKNLPSGQEIKRYSNKNLSQVGKYYYEY